jgi:hypothetical protein
MELSCNRHIYLYAKGHYKRNNILDDLRILTGERCGAYNPRTKTMYYIVELSDILSVLGGIVGEWITDSRKFNEFVADMSPENSWRIGYETKSSRYLHSHNTKQECPEYNYWDAFAYACMKVLRFLSMSDIEAKEGLIGAPDYDLFPMFKPEVIDYSLFPMLKKEEADANT